jgi:hypothetical protein
VSLPGKGGCGPVESGLGIHWTCPQVRRPRKSQRSHKQSFSNTDPSDAQQPDFTEVTLPVFHTCPLKLLLLVWVELSPLPPVPASVLGACLPTHLASTGRNRALTLGS